MKKTSFVLIFISMSLIYANFVSASDLLYDVLNEDDLNTLYQKTESIKEKYDIDIKFVIVDYDNFIEDSEAISRFIDEGLNQGEMSTWNLLVMYNIGKNELKFVNYKECSLGKVSLQNIKKRDYVVDVLGKEYASDEEISKMLVEVADQIESLIEERNPKKGVCYIPSQDNTKNNHENNQKCSDACEQGILGLMPCDIDDCHNYDSYDSYGLNCYFVDEFWDKCEDCNTADDCSDFSTDRTKCKDVNCGGNLNCQWENGECTANLDEEDDGLTSVNKGITIVLDPGHGGKDSGACDINEENCEAKIVFDLANALKNELENRGFDAYLTREENEKPPVQTRRNLANNNNANLFISLHLNSIANKEDCNYARGVQALYYYSEIFSDDQKNNGIVDSTYVDMSSIDGKMLQSYNTADMIFSDLNNKGFFVEDNNNIKASDADVLKNLKMPGLLLELGFVCNNEDLDTLLNRKDEIAESIADSLDDYYNNDNAGNI